jgi:hypothetical protein
MKTSRRVRRISLCYYESRMEETMVFGVKIVLTLNLLSRTSKINNNQQLLETTFAAFSIFFEFHKSCGARSPLRKHARPDKGNAGAVHNNISKRCHAQRVLQAASRYFSNPMSCDARSPLRKHARPDKGNAGTIYSIPEYATTNL